MKKIIILTLLASILMMLACKNDCTVTLWPKGRIPYQMTGFTPEQIAQVVKCMSAWSVLANHRVEFIAVGTGHADAIGDIKPLQIVAHKSGTIGYRTMHLGYSNKSNRMFLNVDETLFNDEHILHELGHVIGLPHEHQRPDVLMYLDIDWSNDIIAGNIDQFIPLLPENFPYDYTRYMFDYHSVMLYSYDDTEGGLHRRNSSDQDFGGTEPSIFDVGKVYQMYQDAQDESNKKELNPKLNPQLN